MRTYKIQREKQTDCILKYDKFTKKLGILKAGENTKHHIKCRLEYQLEEEQSSEVKGYFENLLKNLLNEPKENYKEIVKNIDKIETQAKIDLQVDVKLNKIEYSEYYSQPYHARIVNETVKEIQNGRLVPKIYHLTSRVVKLESSEDYENELE